MKISVYYVVAVVQKKENNEENDADKKKIINKAKWVNKIALLIALDIEDA